MIYDGLKSIEIGIDNSSFIRKPEKSEKKPIIFYLLKEIINRIFQLQFL